MADYRITHVRKPNRQSTLEHITHLGSMSSLGIMIWVRETIINSIIARTDNFYVLENGMRSEIGIVNPNDGRLPFLRTNADNYEIDNLLSLPEC